MFWYIRKKIKKIPGTWEAYNFIKSLVIKFRMRGKNTKEIFTDIYNRNKWKDPESCSGPGSNLTQAGVLIKELPAIFKKYEITSILDIPCGDFHWMDQINLTGIKYSGADIVEEMIGQNKREHEGKEIEFICLDIIRDFLPKVHLILVRDCFVHLANKDILRALKNICKSGSEYLLTTTYISRKKNIDIAAPSWRPINLELPPFNLSPPLEVINEGCTERGDEYSDKSLGLWKISEIHV